MTVRVLVVDDHEAFRMAASAVVAAAKGFQLVGSAASGEASLAAVEELHPDLVLMDIHLPGISGVESTRRIRERQPGVEVLLLSSADIYDDAGQCGALGYLPKRRLSPSRLQGVWAARPPSSKLARFPTEGVTIMETHNEAIDTSAGSSSVGRRSGWVSKHGLLAYALIAYGISWSLLIGGFLGSRAGILNPDGSVVSLIIQIAAAGPLISALIVLALTRGRAGLADLGRSLIRWRVNPLWYAFVFLGVPLLMLAALAIIYQGQLGWALAEKWSLLYTQWPIGVLSIALVTGLAEEPGWRGYAQPTANRRYPPMTAALIVSVIWALWHLPNALFGQSATETATHFLATVVNGFVLAWVYNSTGGSVLLVMLLHGAQNGTNGLVQRLFEGATQSPSPTTYYLVSTFTFGILMAVVAVASRGRLGLPASDAGSAGST